jgi:phosphoenolpyruvate carboxykinase (GTP)
LIHDWVAEVARLTEPSRIVWWEGSDPEYHALVAELQRTGDLIGLNPEVYPDCYLHQSHPGDVARNEERTFICTESREDAGPTNHWMAPEEAKQKLLPILSGSMRGRTLYVVPYVLGPIRSPHRQIGVQVTDSPYVVANLHIMTRTGRIATGDFGKSGDYVRGLHTLSDLRLEHRYLCHFPEEGLIWSSGTGYGGNALLPKKSHALRLAGWAGKKEGWLAEHMLILGLESPAGDMTYIGAAFPSGTGKTNLAMLAPPEGMAGWKIRTIGDDLAWIHPGPDGRLYAINPENGLFATAPGTNPGSNPSLMTAIRQNTLFNNVALAEDGTPWWEGQGVPPSGKLIDWRGNRWEPGGASPAAHPNARFTIPLRQCPTISPHVEDPEGVPLDAILFGGRRRDLAPLVCETFSWEHGVYAGATLRSETTSAAEGQTGRLRWDPMAMLPFCGYNMADYFQHWLRVGRNRPRAPKIFYVNWFREDADGRCLWPGFGENARVLRWIRARCRGEASARRTPLGYIPLPDALDLPGRRICSATFEQLFSYDAGMWERELGPSGFFCQTSR